MNAKNVRKFILAYAEATGCKLIDQSAGHITVKLSPEADRALTGRPYYWSFIDNTGTEPETLSFSWMFGQSPLPESGTPATRLTSVMTPVGRVIREEVYYGSRRLESIFKAVREAGRCVMLFAEPPRLKRGPLESIPYSAWLGVNFKIAYECDMKRERLCGWGISLATGVIDERFLDRVRSMRWTPRLPANIHLLRNEWSLRKAMSQLEQTLERSLKAEDFTWAEEAEARRRQELARIGRYYDSQQARAAKDGETQSEELLQAWQERRQRRENEIDWQYRPRIQATVLNCGVFNLPGLD